MPAMLSMKLVESDAPPKTGFTMRYDYDGSGNLIYQGWSPAQWASATSAAAWAVKKYTYDGSNRLTLAQWANGCADSVNIWDNRTTLSYQ
ncbi:MAG: hypothetical protein ABSG41_15525 [Bryobacteraceae bacterium]|jgi:hypothetical protein